MKNQNYFKVEAAEKIFTDGTYVSGDTIQWAECKTESEAKRVGLKFLKKKNVLSVWIHLVDFETGDFIYQLSKYEDDIHWKRSSM